MVMNNFSQVVGALFFVGVLAGLVFAVLGVLANSDGCFVAAFVGVAIVFVAMGVQAWGVCANVSTGGRVTSVTEFTSSSGTGHRISAVDGFGTSSEKEITDPDANLPSVGDEVVFTPDGWKQQ